MAYHQTVRDDYRRSNEVYEQRAKRSYLPLAILVVAAIAAALWAIDRNHRHEDTSTTTPSTEPRY